MVNGNMKVQTGMRIDKFVFDRFKELCRGERLMVGETVQHLMEACLEAGSVKVVLASKTWKSAAQRKADELRLRGALAELRGFIKAVETGAYLYVSVKDRATRIDQAIYRPAYDVAVAMLSKVQDEGLIREVELVLQKANECMEKVVGE